MRRFFFVLVAVLVAGTLQAGVGASTGFAAPPAAQRLSTSDALVASDTAGTFVSLNPTRVLDTRYGTGAPRTPVPAGGSIAVQITGQPGVPATVAAVAFNITVTQPGSAGYITPYADLTTRPNSSSMNFTTGQTTANLAIIPVGTDGKIRLYNGSITTTQLIGDIAGYYLPGTPSQPGTFSSLNPTRVLDTRYGTGAPRTPVPAGGSIAVQITGQPGVPATVAAVAFNITVTQPGSAGYITPYADLTTRPNSSSMNFTTGQTTANLAIIPVGTDGKIRLYNGSITTTQLIGDIAGYYLPGTPSQPGTFSSLNPTRVLDTRYGTGAPRTPVPAGGSIAVQITGQPGVPATVAAVAFNITVTQPGSAGYITPYADLTTRPNSSSMNFTTGQTTANLAIIPVGTDGKIRLYNGSITTTQLIGDIAGYYLPSGGTVPDPVSGVSADTVTASSLTLHWTNPSGALTGVLIRRATGSTPPPTPASGTLVTDTSATATSFTDTSLAAGTTYSYSLFAHDAAGDAAAASVTVTTKAGPGGFTWTSPQPIDAVHGSPTSISCASSAFCAAVDSLGSAFVYNGSTWTSPASIDASAGQSGGLTSVSCPSTLWCVAVDGAGRAVVRTTGWGTPVTVDGGQQLTAVSCVSSSFCMAVTAAGRAERFNGSAWSASTIDPGTSLAAISCPTTTFCAAVEGAGRVLTWNGSTWSAPRALDALGGVTAVSCVSTSFCVAVDAVLQPDYSSTGHAVTFTSSATGPVSATVDPYAGLTGISCSAVGACTAVDNANSVLTLAGGSWHSTTTAGGPYASVSCAGSFCAAVDAFGSAVLSTSGWATPLTVDPTNTLAGVSCSGVSACTAVGAAGQAMTWNGTGWSSPALVDTVGGMNGISCVATTFCTAIGLVDALTYSGSGWGAPRTIAPDSLLSAVSCATTAFCVAVGDDGSAVVFSGGSWSAPVAVDSAQALIAVDCTSATFCMATDDGGRAYRFTGTGWTGPVPVDTSSDNALVAISCVGTAFCIAVDGGGSGFRFTGSGWSGAVAVIGASPTSVSCSSATSCVAVDTAGEVVTFDGTGWSAPVPVATDSAYLGGLMSVSCPTDSFCVAIDEAGRAVRGSR